MVEKKEFYENKFGNVFGTLTGTPIGRATFCHLVEPNDKYKPSKYGLHILFPKNDEKVKAGLNELIGQCKTLAAQKYGKKVPAFTYGPVRDGDEQSYQGFKGCWYIKCSSKKPIEVVDTKKAALDPNLIAPGVLVRAVVTPIMFDGGFSYTVSCVQFVKDDGVRYYGGPDPKSLLTALGEEEETTESVTEVEVQQEADKIVEEIQNDKKLAPLKGKAAALDML